VTANPNGGWVTNRPATSLLVLGDRGRQRRFVLGDGDATFTRGLDEVFCSQGAEVLGSRSGSRIG